MVFVQFNETDIHVHEGDSYARICLYVKDVRDELLRAVVLYTFSEDSSAKSELVAIGIGAYAVVRYQ